MINYTDYTYNLVQLRPSLIVLVSSCIGIKHCKFIKTALGYLINTIGIIYIPKK
jgi:hypothetical protein